MASTMICGAALAAFAAMPAYAQQAEREADEIVVTGSRIVRQDFEAISPVTTVGSEQLELTGTLTVDTLLNELPQVIPGNTRTSNNAGGEDFSTVDLRGLGPSRTLVLVNGERIPASSTTGVVDLNTIPASLIDRLEVVTGGASAVYGSDAISGVVNFILKDNYEGAELNVSYGQSFDGKAPEFEMNGLLGGNFADGRGNLTAYAAYYTRNSVYQGEFDYSRVSGALCARNADLSDPFVCDSLADVQSAQATGGRVFFNGGSITPPWGIIPGGQGFQNLATILPAQFGAGTYDTNCDGVPNTTPYNTGGLTFDPQGLLSPQQGAATSCGVPTTSGQRQGIRGGSSRYNFAPDNFLIIPAERFNITTIGTYDVNDNLRAKVMLNFVNSNQTVELAPTPAGPGTAIIVTPNAPMLAFIDQVAPDLGLAIRGRTDPSAPFQMWRRFNEVGSRTGFSENNSFYGLLTLEGDINDNWSWSATASYGANRFDLRGTNSVNSTALSQGLAACADADGNPLGILALPGCVPLDVFGENTLTEEMVDFIGVNTFSTTKVEESRISAFARGDLFELPAGPVASVFGVEYRESSASARVDNEQRAGNIKGFNAVQDQVGAIDVYEVYTELAVPLVRDVPFVHYLGLEGGFRYSDYSSVGGVQTYKIGAEYAPVDWLRFRAIYNEATRAPSVFELFQAGDQGFPGYTDPCAAVSNPDAATLAFCSQRAGGFDFTGYTQPNTQVQAFAFGNPDLAPEDASTFTIGAVIQPDWFPIGNLRATVDYYDIEITDVVSAFGAQFFINQCYDSLDPNSAACQRIVRDPTNGNIISVDTTRGNQGSFETSGYDIQLDWGWDVGPGRLRINELLTIVDSYKFNGNEFVGTTSGGIGGAIYDWRSVLTATYSFGDWLLFGRWSYTPGMVDDPFGIHPDNETPEASFVDASVRWNATDRLQLTARVNNVFDEFPPQTIGGGQANTDVQLYRVLGRTWSVSARLRF
jgi:outer membrane receptor protein involved in Fe transport